MQLTQPLSQMVGIINKEALAKEFRFTNIAGRRELQKRIHDSGSSKDRLAI